MCRDSPEYEQAYKESLHTSRSQGNISAYRPHAIARARDVALSILPDNSAVYLYIM